MKKLITILCVMGILQGFSQSRLDWEDASNGIEDSTTILSTGSYDGITAYAVANRKGIYSMYKSIDSARSWVELDPAYLSALASIPEQIGVTKDYVIVVSGGVVYRSFDDGKNWKSIFNGIPSDFNASRLVVHDGESISVADRSAGGRLYYSDNQGSSFVLIAKSDLISSITPRFTSVFKQGDNWLAALGPNSGVEHSLWSSKDNGATWDSLPLPAENFRITDFVKGNGSEVYAMGMRRAQGVAIYDVYKSDSLGSNWEVVDNFGLQEFDYYQSMAKLGNGFLMSGGYNLSRTMDSIFEADTSCTVYDTVTVSVYDTILVSVMDTLVINAVILGINPPNNKHTFKVYPNPANTYLIIDNGDYTKLSGYELKIINSVGQEVYKQPITQQKISTGFSVWSGPGIYFLHIIDNKQNTIEIKKIILQ